MEDFGHSTHLLGATTLRNVLGTKCLAEILSERLSIDLLFNCCKVSAICVQREDSPVDGGHSRRRHRSLGSEGGEGGDVSKDSWVYRYYMM